MKNAILVGLMLMTGIAYASQSSDQPKKVTVPLSNAYIPGGFDSNDRAQVVVDGYFPSTCYRVGPYEKKIDPATNTISVTQSAYKYGGACLFMMVPYTQTVQVGLLKANKYTVQDGNSGKVMGEMPVRAATNSGPDDYLYATVNDAYVGYVDGKDRSIILQGELPGECWALKDKKVIMDGKNVIVVLPVIEKIKETGCNDYRIPFVTTVDLPEVAAGRYLLHVRSLSGQAVNKLVDL